MLSLSSLNIMGRDTTLIFVTVAITILVIIMLIGVVAIFYRKPPSHLYIYYFFDKGHALAFPNEGAYSDPVVVCASKYLTCYAVNTTENAYIPPLKGMNIYYLGKLDDSDVDINGPIVDVEYIECMINDPDLGPYTMKVAMKK